MGDLVRARAARSLGLMGEAALPALLEALQHRDKYVRREATWALRKLGSASEATIQVLAKAQQEVVHRAQHLAAVAGRQLWPRPVVAPAGFALPPTWAKVPAMSETHTPSEAAAPAL